jgi:hypothetical protein
VLTGAGETSDVLLYMATRIAQSGHAGLSEHLFRGVTGKPGIEWNGTNQCVAQPRQEVDFMRADMVPGAVFPDYELSDHNGKHHKLSQLQGPDPMVVGAGRERPFLYLGKSLAQVFAEQE